MPNGAATYAYIEAGHYTLNEEVEGEWNASLTVNGQPVEGMEVDFEAGEFYSVMLTNSSPTPGTIAVSGEITWEDNKNQDGKRPTEVVVKLLKKISDNSSVVSSVSATKDDGWKYNFKDLYGYENGQEIHYFVETEEVSDYTMSISGYNITLSHTPETTDISGKITWEDADNQDGKRPDEVEVKLLADGGNIGKTATVNNENSWEYSFTDLPKYADGNKINYAITGGPVVEYTLKVEGYNITCTHMPETTDISGKITWEDADNQDGRRPDEVKVVFKGISSNGDYLLYQGTCDASESGDWGYSFTGDVYKYYNGSEVVYSISADVDGYISEVNGYNITCTQSTEISGRIMWDDAENQDGKRPAEVTVKLFANEEDTGKEVIVTATDNWAYKFKNLQKYKDGEAISYTVQESAVSGYSSSKTGNGITYTHTPETIEISGQIKWDDANNQDGKRPEQVSVKLVEDGGTIERTIGRTIERNVTVTADADWKYSFKDLPKYRGGREIVYGVNATVEGYTLTTTGYDIKCTHTPETIDVMGTITWEDADDQDGKRPEKVKVELLANGESIGKTKTVTAKDNWSYRFKDLPKYKAGKEIEYTIKNETLEGYTSKIDDNHNLTYSKIEEKTETPEDKKPESEDKKPVSEDKKPVSEDKKPVSEDKTSTSNAPATSGNGVSSNPAQTNSASSNSVPTGDSNNLWLAGLLFIAALCGLCVSIKKRSNTDK